jgi:hypothetical protein
LGNYIDFFSTNSFKYIVIYDEIVPVVQFTRNTWILRNASFAGYEIFVSFFKVTDSIIFDVNVAIDDNKDYEIAFISNIELIPEIKPIEFQFWNSNPKDYFIRINLNQFEAQVKFSHHIYCSVEIYGTIISYELLNNNQKVSLSFEEYSKLTVSGPFYQ